MLTLVGSGGVAVGATTPTESLWIKVVGILCGLIVALMGLTFTTLMAHVVGHGEASDKKIEKQIKKQAQYCGLKMQTMSEKIDKIHDHICGKSE